MSWTFLLRRLLLAIPTLFGVAVIVFVLLRVVPGDPIAMLIGPGATEADIAELRRLYGLDESIALQFVYYLRDLAGGDFGTSISMRQDVMELVLGRLPVTIELCLVAMLVAVGLGGAMALAGAYWRGRSGEAAVDGAAGFILAIPDFLWALLFILFVVVFALDGLPISGRIGHDVAFRGATGFLLVESLLRLRLDAFGSVLLHTILPALALALPLAAIVARVLKTSINEAMTQDYILMARVKGFSRARIVGREALRNALVPTVTLTGVQFTFLVGGTVLVEKIFSYPGIGNMAIDAVINRDLPLIQGLVLTFAVLFIAVNLLVDVSYALLNPRMRHG
ncbi:MAG: ABC transporter permease [Defluviicoccus sp.]|nr:ABC transporter permease [Defluviicoccus sp.]MDE0279226.1 ABC transporter permease [Defluviicoccus sp.]